MRLNPEVPAAAHNLGLLQAKNKQPDAAIQIWEDNLRLNPQFVPSRMSLANAYVAKAKFDEAIAASVVWRVGELHRGRDGAS